MHIEYISHSCFLVRCGNKRILFDPWLIGGTYDNAWHLWPLPSKTPAETNPDIILISHGHEDHLNRKTLNELNKKAKVFFPFQWRGGITTFLKQLGFNYFTEAINFKTYMVEDIEITFAGFSLESVIIIKHGNRVLVNINDALNSNHENASNFLLKEIKKRWPKIDYLLSGWSGAGYFPNQIRYKGKDDIQIAKLREQYFANNFCVYTKYLQPKFSLPIAPGFVLLAEENQWINHIKFKRTKLSEYYKKHFEYNTNVAIVVLNPGDSLNEETTVLNSGLTEISEETSYNDAYSYYSKELNAENAKLFLTEVQINELIEKLNYWINYNKQIYEKVVLQDSTFSIHLLDVKVEPYLNIIWEKASFVIKRAQHTIKERKVLIHTYGRKLNLCLSREWGGDIITSGYALKVEIYDTLSLERNLDIVCVRLITRYPLARKDLRRFPLRALKFYLSSPKSTGLWLKQKWTLKPYVNKYPFNERDHWITYNKCELCKVCKMPEVDQKLFHPQDTSAHLSLLFD